MTIRVILADDHQLVRQGLRALLEKAGDIKVIGEAADGQQAVELAGSLTPDVVVMDLSMPRLHGTEATGRVRALRPAPEVVMLSMHSDESLVRQALRSGARGYVLKRSATEELLLAVRAASRGQTYLSPAISGPILADYLAGVTSPAEASPLDRLTSREREVLQLVAEGRTNREVGMLLTISLKTVEKHRARVMSKLNVCDLPALMRVAIRHGLVPLDE